MRDVFEKLGLTISRIRVIRDKNTLSGKGFGYVEFAVSGDLVQLSKLGDARMIASNCDFISFAANNRDLIASRSFVYFLGQGGRQKGTKDYKASIGR